MIFTEDFIQTTQKIQEDQTVFQLPISLYTCTEDFHKDTISIKLMPEDANQQLIPIETVGDENCLFTCISLVLFGNEDNHREVRVRTVVELSSNVHLYTSFHTIKKMAEFSYNKILEYIIQASISDEACDDNLWSSFKKEVMLSTRNGVDASILHLFAIVMLLKCQ